ncbi:MAG: glycosyltransferase [Muribaculaceae bacterium]|nr:glycosyltransferase [Bacteroidales bacterium]MDY2733673.1 glycosyltransferase [Muribaculaceae bacterium]
MKRVITLMSTYNGDKYLDAQIRSIMDQQGVDVTLLIRDDGSSDGTLSLLERWRKAEPDRIEVIADNNMGFVASFSRLIKEGLKRYKEAEIFAFADQDDVWLSDKLARGVKAIEGKEEEYAGRPIAYASNTMLVDSELNEIGLRWRCGDIEITRSRGLVENFATGCTMLFNRKAAEIYDRTYRPGLKVHDFRMYQIALFAGCFIWDKESRILYRQHSGNQIGSQPFWGRMKRRLLKKRYKEHTLEKQNRAFLRDCGDELDPEGRALIERFCDYRKNLKTRFQLFANREIGYSRRESDFFYRLKVLMGTV